MLESKSNNGCGPAYVRHIIAAPRRLLLLAALVLCSANQTDMYKGIGQYFPFHVEMNPFQKGQNHFHPWLHCGDFWEAAFSLKCAQKGIRPIRKFI